jgi:hypothetical protein
VSDKTQQAIEAIDFFSNKVNAAEGTASDCQQSLACAANALEANNKLKI